MKSHAPAQGGKSTPPIPSSRIRSLEVIRRQLARVVSRKSRKVVNSPSRDPSVRDLHPLVHAHAGRTQGNRADRHGARSLKRYRLTRR